MRRFVTSGCRALWLGCANDVGGVLASHLITSSAD